MRIGLGLGLTGVSVLSGAGNPNLLARPIEFDNAAWSKGNVTVSANAIAAPDGTTTAEKLVETTATTVSHTANQSRTVASNTAHAFSVYLKAAERSRVVVYFGKSGSPFTRLGALVDLAAGTVTAANSGSPTSVTQRALEALPNNWYRVKLAGIFDTTSTDGIVEVRLDNGTTTSYTGDGTSGLYVWGAKLELGPVATAFRP